MNNDITDADLEQRLRAADPLSPEGLPTEAETEAALRRLLAIGPGSPRRSGRLVPAWRPRLLAAVSAGLAAAGAALVLLLGATTASPAFAVTRNHDGTITVRLMKLSAIAAANQRLASMGVRVKLARTADMAVFLSKLRPCQGKAAGTVTTVTFKPWTVPLHQVVILRLTRLGTGSADASKALKQARAFARHHRTMVTPVAALQPAVRTSHPNAQVITVYCGRIFRWTATGAARNRP